MQKPGETNEEFAYRQSDVGQIVQYTIQIQTPYRMYQDRNQNDANLTGVSELFNDNSNTSGST